MPNKDLIGKTYNIDSEHQKFCGPTLTYDALKMKVSRLKKAKEDKNLNEFGRLGGDKTLIYLEGLIKTDRDAIKGVKTTGMKAGRENEFIRNHEKDTNNANPTGVGGVPKMTKGSINRKISQNSEVYNENLTKEIKDMKYLIEYLDNNKKSKI
jgi:hypothetical protein